MQKKQQKLTACTCLGSLEMRKATAMTCCRGRGAACRCATHAATEEDGAGLVTRRESHWDKVMGGGGGAQTSKRKR
uniref:Uncharacterized protein n=1 Tax=Setaria italica TaxID=4555 RepID=K4A3H0_SETIT